MAPGLRSFDLIDPNQFLQGNLGEWVKVILFVGLFIALVNAVFTLLPQFKNNPYRNKLAMFLGLILGLGLYTAQRLYNFNFQSFGFISIWFIIFLIGIVSVGLFRMGMDLGKAVALSYCVIYLSFLAISPSLFDAISTFFPLLNIVLLLVFFYLAFTSIASLVKGKTPNIKELAGKLQRTHFTGPEDIEIDKEINEDKAEVKDVKKASMKTTKRELRTTGDINNLLGDMIRTIQKNGDNITKEEIGQLVSDLRQIYKAETILTGGMNTIKQHIRAYNALHRKDIPELEKRLRAAKDQESQQPIKEEIEYQKQMLKVIDFMNQWESKLNDFGRSFNLLLQTAIRRLQESKPGEAMMYMKNAHGSLMRMRQVYNQQKEFERYLMKLDKKTIADLKKEKARRS